MKMCAGLSHIWLVPMVTLLLFDCQLPYEYLTPLQAAVGVVQKVCHLFFLI